MKRRILAWSLALLLLAGVAVAEGMLDIPYENIIGMDVQQEATNQSSVLIQENPTATEFYSGR